MREAKLSSDAAPVAREIHRRATLAGLAPKALSLKAGLNETYVRDLYVGKSKNPKNEQLGAIARALNCSVTELTAPELSKELDQEEYAAKTTAERTLLTIWRSASLKTRNQIAAAVEGILMDALTGLREPDDIRRDG